jgi:hypothetical protein
MMSGESTLVGMSQWLNGHKDELLAYLLDFTQKGSKTPVAIQIDV